MTNIKEALYNIRAGQGKIMRVKGFKYLGERIQDLAGEQETRTGLYKMQSKNE